MVRSESAGAAVAALQYERDGRIDKNATCIEHRDWDMRNLSFVRHVRAASGTLWRGTREKGKGGRATDRGEECQGRLIGMLGWIFEGHSKSACEISRSQE